jgi:hypothetical protein
MPLGFEARNDAGTLQVGQWNTETSKVLVALFIGKNARC